MQKHRTSIEFPEDLWRQLSGRISARRRTAFIIEAVRDKLIRESMRCLILCGGFGVGMGPLSKSIPKAMMPVGYKPLLEHIICKLRDQGFHYFILAVSHLSEHIMRYFGDGGSLGVKIDYSLEKFPLGTAGAIKNAGSKLNGRFLVVYGDILFNGLNISGLLGFHEEKNAIATMVLARVEDASRFGLVSVDDHGRVIAFREKPKQPVPGFVNTGIYVFEPQILDYIPALTYCSLEEHVFPALIEKEKLYAYPYNGYWVDIGSPEDYEQAWKDYFAGLIE